MLNIRIILLLNKHASKANTRHKSKKRRETPSRRFPTDYEYKSKVLRTM